MKNKSALITFTLFAIFNAQCLSQTITYEVDITNHKDDLFHVIVLIDGLSSENNIYNLPATVPGTYSNLNFGRFVTSFKAYDKEGKELLVKKNINKPMANKMMCKNWLSWIMMWKTRLILRL